MVNFSVILPQLWYDSCLTALCRTTRISRYQNVFILEFIGAGDYWSNKDMQCSSEIVTISKLTPSFLHAGFLSCCATNRVRALKESCHKQNTTIFFSNCSVELLLVQDIQQWTYIKCFQLLENVVTHTYGILWFFLKYKMQKHKFKK